MCEVEQRRMPPIRLHDDVACKADKQANLDFTVKDMNGASVRLADYKGKVILVNFWATWCPPCKVELPRLHRPYRTPYKDQGLVILGISGDDDPGDAAHVRVRMEDQLSAARRPRRREAASTLMGRSMGYPTSVHRRARWAVCGRHVGPATKEEFESEIKALL